MLMTTLLFSVMSKLLLMTNANVDGMRVHNETWAQQLKVSLPNVFINKKVIVKMVVHNDIWLEIFQSQYHNIFIDFIDWSIHRETSRVARLKFIVSTENHS